MIREVTRDDIPVCVDIIRKSFKTVAEKFGFTRDNAPRFTAFATTEERLYWQMDNEPRLMFVYEQNGVICGYYSLLMQDNNECELNNLAVLPEYRHCGIGKTLLEHAYETARNQGCKRVNIGIVEENIRLRKWYEQNGAVHTGTKKFDFFPFTCGYRPRGRTSWFFCDLSGDSFAYRSPQIRSHSPHFWELCRWGVIIAPSVF